MNIYRADPCMHIPGLFSSEMFTGSWQTWGMWELHFLFTVCWLQVMLSNVSSCLAVTMNKYRHNMKKTLFISAYCHSNMMVQHLGVRFSAEQQFLSVLMTAALEMKMNLRGRWWWGICFCGIYESDHLKTEPEPENGKASSDDVSSECDSAQVAAAQIVFLAKCPTLEVRISRKRRTLLENLGLQLLWHQLEKKKEVPRRPKAKIAALSLSL